MPRPPSLRRTATTGGSKMALVLVLLACHGVRGARREGRRPWFVRCQDSSECGPDRCCSVLEGRYMVPMCLPKQGRPGQECSGESVNVTARYPRAVAVRLTDVHMERCPCQESMVCEEGICRLHDVQSNSLVPAADMTTA